MAETALQDPPPIPLSNAPLLSTAEVISLAEVAARRAEKFGAMIDTLAGGIAAKAAEVAKSLESAGYPRRDAEAAAAKAAYTARTTIMQNSDKERWDRIKELNAAAESLATVDLLFANPVVVLSRAGLGTPERTAFMHQIEGSGPAELRQLAAFAIATKNRVLGAALVSAIDRMPRKDRPFSAAELADHLCGDETRKVRAAIDVVKVSAQKALNLNREFSSGRSNPLDKISLALRQQKET